MAGDDRRLNVGFLGLGSLMSKQHLPNAYYCPWMRVHTLCDLNAGFLSKYDELYAPKRTTTDYGEMFADSEIEMVVIATDPSLHAGFAMEALNAGKHVYVEKPLSEDIGSALEVDAVSSETGKHLAIGFNRRFAPAYLDAYEIIRDESGPIMMSYRMVDDYRDRPAWAAQRPRLLDECCHVFDILTWFAKSEPTRIFATGIGRSNEHQVVIEYANGVTASLFTSSHGAFHWPKERIEIVGDNKVVAVEEFIELQLGGVPGWKDKRYAGREYDGFTKGYAHMFAELGLPFYRQLRCTMADLILSSGLIESEPEKEKWSLIGQRYPERLRIPIGYAPDKGWQNALIHFGKCILEGVTPRNAGARDGVRSVAMSLAAMESTRSRQPVDIEVVW